MQKNKAEEYSNPDKWVAICDLTLNNYANMMKRLTVRSQTANLLLIYYSFMLIVISITSKFFPKAINDTFSDYFSIILSILLLVFSLVIQNSRYSERIKSLETSINALKTIKRTINESNIPEKSEEYNRIVDNTEMRTDHDFFNTVRMMCKRHNVKWYWKVGYKENESKEVKKLKDYLSEINVPKEISNILFWLIRDFILTVIPIVVFGICFLHLE